MRLLILALLVALLSSCATRMIPPSDVNNACTIFRQNPSWLKSARDVERRWRVPIPVQMAIIYQESKFNPKARPARTKLFHVVPWKRPSSAYGYAQVLTSTWKEYKRQNGGFLTSRTNFGDGLDFIGWYANEANKKAGISRSDAYSLYLAYHEGIGGYQRRTYLKRPWVMSLAHKVSAKALSYRAQMNSCYLSKRSF